MRKKWLWLIPAALLLAVAVTVLSNLTLIKSFSGALKYVGQDTTALSEESDAVITEKTKEITGVEIVELTEEQKDALFSGELSEQEAVDIILGKTQENTQTPDKTDNSENSGTPPKTETPLQKEPTKDENPKNETPTDPETARIGELVAGVYILRDTFSKRIDALFAQARAEYIALPNEARTPAKYRELLTKYAKTAGNLETECDGRIKEISGELTYLLESTGRDTSIVDEIIYAYALEKDAKKAYYIGIYKDKLTKVLSS